MEQQEILSVIKSKTEKLIDHHRILFTRYEKLKSAHEQLLVEKDQLTESNKELLEQIKTIKLAQSINGVSPDQDAKPLKTKLNEYIREIDKCLALLNRD